MAPTLQHGEAALVARLPPAGASDIKPVRTISGALSGNAVISTALVHMWNDPAGKCFFRCFGTWDGAVICTAFQRGFLTAGLDEVRDASG